MQNIFLIISIIAGFVSPIIGITSILGGGFRPQRMTRFLILLLSLLFVSTLLAQGDRNGIFIAVAQLIGSAIIFILSIKRGMGGTNRLDYVVMGLSVSAIIVWKSTNNPLLGLMMSIAADFVGFIPTLVKTWKMPETEEWKFYMSDVVASFFSILSITIYTPNNLAFPIYIFLINTTSVIMILLRKKYLK